ncbi:MAG TPA: class I SAM-dependent methyltransferase [Aliidongia sp.]|nr:class I SAM-dependent methyltransferase [Aliidongia sp.]
MTDRPPLRMPREYAKGQYIGTPDPWGFVTSGYERRKYDEILAAIGDGHRNALEMGCSVGVFTHRLAAGCDRLLAVDVSETALDAARRRCSDLARVEFRQILFADQLPDDRFDLVVLAEAGYYWSLPDLDLFLRWLRRTLTPDGHFVLVHWTGGTDYPLTGAEVHDHVAARTHGTLRPIHKNFDDFYRLDVFAGRARPIA